MFHEGLLPIALAGTLSTGESWGAEVLLPHPYTFASMKLFAFRDRLRDADKEYGRYHALDLYTILATMMESEWNLALELQDRFKDDPAVLEAGQVVCEHFSALDRLGMIRMRESSYYRPGLQLDDFMSALQELFPVKAQQDTEGI